MKMKQLYCILISLITSNLLTAQTPGWVWVKSTGEQYAANYAKDVATDQSGHIYLTGLFGSTTVTFGATTLTRTTGSTQDIFIAKYAPNGNVLWAKNAAIGYAEECALTTDAESNVIVAGTFQKSLTLGGTTLTHTGAGVDLFIAKFDSAGTLLWAQNAPYTTDLWVYDVATDPMGNIFVSGSYGSIDINFGGLPLTSYANVNPFIVKYSAQGNAEWARGMEQSTGGIAVWGNAVTTDIDGNSYLCGDYIATANNTITVGGNPLPSTNGGRDMYLAKYDTAGSLLWVKTTFGISTNNNGRNDIAKTLTTDLAGNIYMAGHFESMGLDFVGNTIINTDTIGTTDVFVAKFTGDGTSVWAKRAGGKGNDQGERLCTDKEGNIYLTGYTQSKPAVFGPHTVTKNSLSEPTVYVVKYDTAGNEEWVNYVDETSGRYSNGIAVDNAGNIYVSGSAEDDAVFGNTTLTEGGVFIAKLGEVQQVGINDAGNEPALFMVFNTATSGLLSIISNNDFGTEVNNYTIYNMQGQVITRGKLTGKQTTVNISAYSAGGYMLQVGNTQRHTYKIFKH